MQHANTNISNIGGASAPTEFVVLDTEGGARTTTGSSKDVTANRNTASECNIGDIVKYIHLMLKGARRSTQSESDGQGWMEWALVCVKRSETSIPVTNMGIQTLGNVATNMYRNECIYTGSFPIGQNQPNQMEAMIKIPPFKQKLRDGDEWRFYYYFRDLLATSTSTDAIRTVASMMYKAYM